MNHQTALFLTMTINMIIVLVAIPALVWDIGAFNNPIKKINDVELVIYEVFTDSFQIIIYILNECFLIFKYNEYQKTLNINKNLKENSKLIIEK